VGLAPGKHGANATGRPFTGDYAGVLLYQTLYKFGFANKEASVSAEDGLKLTDCRITNAVKCLPPENKPTNAEVIECNQYLQAELSQCAKGSVILALGVVAHKAVLKSYNLVQARYPFGHGHLHSIAEGILLLDSYHCSRYNTQTRRLTTPMFEEILGKARELVS
jgi:uracil-DNA glycosylase family 4